MLLSIFVLRPQNFYHILAKLKLQMLAHFLTNIALNIIVGQMFIFSFPIFEKILGNYYFC